MTEDYETRLAEVQLATARAMSAALAEMRPFALRILDADAQLRAMLRIIDEGGEPQ
jgi:hypothetical protein